MTPEEIQRIMALQVQLSQQQAAPSGNPLLVGNDSLRQQIAEHPELAPTNNPGWLDQREQHLLGNDAPPIITAVAPPAQSAPPIPPQMPATAPNPPPQSLPPVPVPQQPPMLPQAPQAQLPPPPLPTPPVSAPQLSQQAQITPLPQQAPVMSQVSPAPKAPASAQINNDVTMPQQTFTPAYQPPALPTLLNPSLIQNHPYSAAPSMPGYGMPRTGSPFTAHPAAGAPQLPSFSNPFASPGGPIAGLGGGVGSMTAPTFDQTPYDQNFYARLMMPGVSQY